MATYLRQLGYLLYKNAILKYRRKVAEAASLLCIIVTLLLLVNLKECSNRTYKAIPSSNRTIYNANETLDNHLAYVTNVNANGTVAMSKVVAKVKELWGQAMTQFNTEEKMDIFFKNYGNISIGLILNQADLRTFSYTIKVPDESIPDHGTMYEKNQATCREYLGPCEATKYLETGFATIQSIVDLAFIQVATNQMITFNVTTQIQMFPKPKYTESLEILKTLVTFAMLFAFLPCAQSMQETIVSEKMKMIKESLKVMGLNIFAFWLSWFITYAITISIWCLIITIISSYFKIYGDTNGVIVFLLLFLYGLSIITLSFVFTPLINQPKDAYIITGFMAILSFPVYIHLHVDTPVGMKKLTSLLSPVAFVLGLTECLDLNSPVKWDNITSKGQFPVSNALIMLTAETIIYFLIALYLDAVFPGKHGKGKHPLFIFKKCTCCGDKETCLTRQRSLLNSPQPTQEGHTGNIEDVLDERMGNKVISVNKISKCFKQGCKKPLLKALDGVSFSVCEGQITALLGHNGAGKSTLISILTGMLQPSGGRVDFYGLDITDNDDMDDIRKIIGLCPQENNIFDYLNPREHLTVFAGIKGVPSSQRKHMIDNLLEEIGLREKAGTLAKDLSDGQKRKLCVGIALIGDPKIVFLDEPTRGMDPVSRRQIWSLLQSKREGRVVFLTTCFMEEADMLADYKIIMSNGKVRCAGSSLFLKSRFGIGYNLRMVVEPDANTVAIESAVKDSINDAQFARQHGNELAFLLPLSESDKFENLFSYFESLNNTEKIFSVPDLGIVSYGISMTTLEDVFMKLAEEEDDNSNETSELEENTGLRNKSLLTAGETDIGASSNNLYASTAVFEKTDSRDGKRHISFRVHLMALLKIKFWMAIRSTVRIIFKIVLLLVLLLVLPLVPVTTELANRLSPKTSSLGGKFPYKPCIYLQQEADSTSTLFPVLYKVANNADYAYMNKSFASMQLRAINVSKFDLLEQAPHSVAYDVKNVSTQGQVSYILHFNDSHIHSIPVGINTLSNAMYKQISAQAGKNILDFQPIKTYSKIFQSHKSHKFNINPYVSMFLTVLVVMLILSGFSRDIIRTRKDGILHQSRISGMNRAKYWLSYLISDLLMSILPLIALFICIAALNGKPLKMSTFSFVVFVTFILPVPGNALFAYTISLASDFAWIILEVLGLVSYFTVIIMEMSSITAICYYKLVIILSVLSPPFTLMYSLCHMKRMCDGEPFFTQKTNLSIHLSKYIGWMNKNPLPVVFLIMFGHTLLFMWTLCAVDCYQTGGDLAFPLSLFKKLNFKHKQSIRSSSVQRSDSMLPRNKMNSDEKGRVNQYLRDEKVSDTSVLVQGLKKSSRKKRVVNDINMIVERGEIFGILGPNGAGKTTTLNMITADLHPDKGKVFVDGFNIQRQLKNAFNSLGYCPEFDALWEDITVREHLKFYCLIKGVPMNEIKRLVESYGKLLQITDHLDKRTKQCSTGTKRKLSFLISMIGDSSVIIMDEPSRGMDPSARRLLWKAISSNITTPKGALLTTHSMEDAEALCDRVGIMIKGELKYVGTIQEFKNAYGGGCQLEIKFTIAPGETHIDRKTIINDYIIGLFPTAVEVEYFGARVTFKIPRHEVRNLSKVFNHLEKGKKEMLIEEYSLSQYTLEQVFVEFVKKQEVEESENSENDSDDHGAPSA